MDFYICRFFLNCIKAVKGIFGTDTQGSTSDDLAVHKERAINCDEHTNVVLMCKHHPHMQPIDVHLPQFDGHCHHLLWKE